MEKRVNITSLMTVFLLLIQVALSTAIVLKLNALGSGSLPGNPPVPSGPSFIDDVSVDDDPVLGNPEAPITIVEFADYECGFCAQAEEAISRILVEYDGMILFVYRDFPLVGHANAFMAAVAADCAGDQDAYWEMHQILFANQQHLDVDSIEQYASEIGLDAQQFKVCLESDRYAGEVNHDIEDGHEYQVSGTPTFFVNGHRVVGASYDGLKQQVDSIIQEEGLQPPSKTLPR